MKDTTVLKMLMNITYIKNNILIAISLVCIKRFLGLFFIIWKLRMIKNKQVYDLKNDFFSLISIVLIEKSLFKIYHSLNVTTNSNGTKISQQKKI